MSYERKEVIGDCTLYLGDCMDVMPTLDPVDAIITDPPYGIEYSASKNNLPYAQKFNILKNDDVILDLGFIFKIDVPTVIFGGYNFFKQLPHKGRWICWDKRCTEKADNVLGSPFELAWENRKSGYDTIIRVQHGGVINSDSANEKRVHPTQKPVLLMKKIIQLKAYSRAQTILDPFMGSGTTGVACVKLGRKFIGIEKDPEYFRIACKRIRDAYSQPDLFVPEPEKPIQENFF